MVSVAVSSGDGFASLLLANTAGKLSQEERAEAQREASAVISK